MRHRLSRAIIVLPSYFWTLPLSSLFEVRFCASEFVAIKAIWMDLPVIDASLVAELDVLAVTQEKRTKINGWLRKIRQFKFAAYCVTVRMATTRVPGWGFCATRRLVRRVLPDSSVLC